jgi:glycosyltransferase involved in cell wall biosynthesis
MDSDPAYRENHRINLKVLCKEESCMKVLFVAYYDPLDINQASGVDYFFHRAVVNSGFEVKIIGPYKPQPVLLERLMARAYQRTGRRYIKFPMTMVWKASQETNHMVEKWQPDVVFSIHLAPFVFYRGKAPCVFWIDSTSYGRAQFRDLYGKPANRVAFWQEKRTFANSSRVITHSDWSRRIISEVYKYPNERIVVFPIPSALPPSVVPEKVEIPAWKSLDQPLRLLLVGRDFERKGIGTALEVVQKLNEAGVPANLTICGGAGQDSEFVKYAGPFKKDDPVQLAAYVDLYRQAHLLIHPAKFEAAGIVPSEAAAFGTPTITNDVGGLATTVADQESGIVLPGGSSADEYVRAILQFIKDPSAYYQMCQRARDRFERELTWDVSDRLVADTIEKASQDVDWKRKRARK